MKASLAVCLEEQGHYPTAKFRGINGANRSHAHACSAENIRPKWLQHAELKGLSLGINDFNGARLPVGLVAGLGNATVRAGENLLRRHVK